MLELLIVRLRVFAFASQDVGAISRWEVSDDAAHLEVISWVSLQDHGVVIHRDYSLDLLSRLLHLLLFYDLGHLEELGDIHPGRWLPRRALPLLLLVALRATALAAIILVDHIEARLIEILLLLDVSEGDHHLLVTLGWFHFLFLDKADLGFERFHLASLLWLRALVADVAAVELRL